MKTIWKHIISNYKNQIFLGICGVLTPAFERSTCICWRRFCPWPAPPSCSFTGGLESALPRE